MPANIVSFMQNTFQTSQIKPIKPAKTTYSNNPFANPFLGTQNPAQNFYGKNKPVSGGYFAGYYNGKANIVGTRLFVEV